MSERDPLQVVLILDATATISKEDVVAVLPDYEQAPKVHRLSDYGGGDLERSSHKMQPDWHQQSRSIMRLAQAVKGSQTAGADIELYVTGDARLPLFVQLGHELRDWKHRLIFIDRRGDKKSWELFDLAVPDSLEKESFDTPLFDHVHGPPALASLRPDRCVDVFVSSRGAPLNRALLARYHDQLAANPPNLIEIRCSNFLTLTPANVNQAAEELRRQFHRFLHETDVTLFVHGPAVLAFVVGRALDVRQHQAVVPIFDRNEFRPALRFPVAERIATPQHITVGVIYARSAADTANQLLIHLRAAQRDSRILLDAVDLEQDIVPGDDIRTARIQLLAKCDILTPLLNAGFFNSDLAELVHANRRADCIEVPLLESYVSLPDDYSERMLLPRDRLPLRSQSNLDKALSEIVQEIKRTGEALLQQRHQQEALSSSRRIPAVQTLPTTVAECLDAIARDFDQLPRLRYTEDDRYTIWERLIDFLDHRHPEQTLQTRLRAPSRDQVAKHKKYAPNSTEPAILLPDDPLKLVLDLLNPDEAARWLYLGAVEVNPRLKFPRWHGTEQDLVERLSTYPAPSDWSRWAEQSRYLFDNDCQSLRATMQRQHPESLDELKHAVRLLGEFRSNEPFTDNLPRDMSQVCFVGLLTVIGARAFFQGDLPLAESAYRAAWQRAKVDENELAEWVSVRGLLSAIRCQTSFDGRSPRVSSQEETDCEQRRDELEQTPFVTHFRERLQATQLHTQSSLIDRLHSDLNREQRTMYVGSSAGSLAILLHDQEELGETPMSCGETATLVGKICLLLNNEVRNLRYAVELLCRYGVKNSGGKDFYSVELSAALPGWNELLCGVFQGGRTHGERLARLEFLKHYLTEIPPALVPTAWTFYQQLLDQYLSIADRECQRVKADSYVLTEGVAILEDIVDQSSTLAGYSKQGPKLLLMLLHRDPTLCWQLVLSRFLRHAWHRWVALGELDPETVNGLLQRIIELLDTADGRTLFSPSKRWHSLRFRMNNIPIGIAQFLQAIQQLPQVPKPLVEQLHEQLCRLLEQGVEADPSFDSRTFFTHPITEWLGSRQDPQTLRFVERHVARMLTKIEQSTPSQIDVDTWAALGESLFLLRSSDWTRLHSLVDRDLDRLCSELASQRKEQLIWLAAALINQDQIPILQDRGRQLLRKGTAHSAGLLAAAAANPERIQSDRLALERAVLASVRQVSDFRQLGTRYGAIHNFIAFHGKTEPLCGWKRWLQPILSQLYLGIEQPNDTISALRTVDLALKRIPEHIEQRATLDALCWLLGHARGRVRDEALYVAVHHRALLDQVDKELLSEALAPFDSPPTLSVEWTLRQASIPPCIKSP